jgi:WD40 repeat protein
MAMALFCGGAIWLGRTYIFAKTAIPTPTFNDFSNTPGLPSPTPPSPATMIPGPIENIPVPPPATQPASQPTSAPSFNLDIKRISYFETQVLKLAWLPDNKQVILSGFDLQPYDVASQAATTPINQKILDDVAVRADGKMFVIATTWDGIQLFDQNWGKLGTLPMSTDGHAVVFTPDGTKVMAAEGNLIKVWDTATQQELPPLPLSERVDGLAISPDGKTLAASYLMDIKILSIEGEELFTLSGHGHEIFALAFSPDGKILASGSLDNTIRLWDVSTGRQLRVLNGHTGTVNGVAFSPDGKCLASGSDDTTAKVWDVSSGSLLQTLYDHTESVTSVAFSPDGTMLATGSYDKMQLWNVVYTNP